jgi:hypothetical protein
MTVAVGIPVAWYQRVAGGSHPPPVILVTDGTPHANKQCCDEIIVTVRSVCPFPEGSYIPYNVPVYPGAL